MLNVRAALLTLPLTLALGGAAMASTVSLSSLTRRTHIAARALCSDPTEPARVKDAFLEYPAISQLAGREGVAKVGVELSAAGQFVRAWPVESSGDPNLDRAALESARASVYAPERSDCSEVGG